MATPVPDNAQVESPLNYGEGLVGAYILLSMNKYHQDDNGQQSLNHNKTDLISTIKYMEQNQWGVRRHAFVELGLFRRDAKGIELIELVKDALLPGFTQATSTSFVDVTEALCEVQ